MTIKDVWRGGFLILLLAPRIISAQDHLEPQASITYAAPTSYDYCRNLSTLFFDKTPSNSGYLARMVCRPGFNKPEWSVTVYKSQEQNCTVEYVAAEKPIDHSKDSLKIKVSKATQPIDFETAQIVERMFRRMLRGVRYPDQEKEGGDGDRFDFSRNVLGWGGFDRKPGDPLPGSEQGYIYDPDEGSLTEKLVNIGEALKRFATAESEEKRDSIRTEIRLQAKELESKASLAPPPK